MNKGKVLSTCISKPYNRQVTTTSRYGTGPLTCMLSTGFPILRAWTFSLSTSSIIIASLAARVLGVNLLRSDVGFQSDREDTPSVTRIFCSTKLCDDSSDSCQDTAFTRHTYSLASARLKFRGTFNVTGGLVIKRGILR